MKPLISVIVPIYNVELYLRECIESIINQTYQNLEIILVDDGSPDKCGLICDQYAENDNRIVVIHKKNGGLSDARNTGLVHSHGDYIVFVDSDDCMTLDGIEYLYQLAVECCADLVIGGVEKFDDETGNIIKSTRDKEQTPCVFNDRQDAMKSMFLNGCASWARIYKRCIHENILFPVGEINEDEAIVLKILNQCERVVESNHVVYRYRYRKQSITSTKWHKKKMDWYYHCKENLDFIQDNYPNLIKYARYRYCSSIIWCLNNMTADVKKFCNEICKLRVELKKLLKENSNMYPLSKKETVRAFLLVHFYYIYSVVVKIMNKHYT